MAYFLRSIALRVRYAGFVGVVLTAGLAYAEEVTIRLTTGDQFLAEVLAGSTPDAVRCQTRLTSDPILIPLDAIASLHFPARANDAQPAAEYQFELWGDDLLYGRLQSLTGEKCVIDSSGIGTIQLPRAAVERISRTNRQQNLLDLQAAEQPGWEILTHDAPWQAVDAQLVARRSGATIYRDIDLPDRATIEIAISWKEDPDFVFAIGVDRDNSPATSPFRLEVWDDSVLLVRETDDQADLVLLQEAPEQSSELRLSLFLDKPAGTLTAVDRAGKQLGQLQLPVPATAATRGVRLTNRRGTTRLEQLRVAAWDGRLPESGAESVAWVRLTDQTVHPGDALLLDDQAKLVVRNQDVTTTHDQSDVSEIVLSIDGNALPQGPATVELKLHHSMQLTGQIVAFSEDRMTLKLPAVATDIQIPRVSIEAITVRALASEVPWPPGLRAGRLEAENMVIYGVLQNGPIGDSPPLVWHARGAREASPLQIDLSGRIVFADASSQGVDHRRPDRGRRLPANESVLGDPDTPRPLLGNAVYFRSGDVVSADVESIDDAGVHLEASLLKAATIPREAVKAVVFWDAATLPTLDELRRRRLLSTPRSMTDRPPLHLIGSKDGDYLRCRMLTMDEETIRIESRGEIKELPRRYVAWIVWLNELNETPPKQQASTADQQMKVQAVRRDGVRLTMMAEKVQEGALLGTSAKLGPCQVKLAEIDALRFGKAIAEAATESPFQDWKLQPPGQP